MATDRNINRTRASAKSSGAASKTSESLRSEPASPASETRAPEHVRAAELFGAAYWLAQQIGVPSLFSVGVTTHGDRLNLLRQAIRDRHLVSARCPPFRGVKDATYEQAFALMFGVPFGLAPTAG